MKNKTLLLLIAISIFITGCGSKKTVEFNESIVEQNTVAEENQGTDEENISTDIIEDESAVSIILTMYSFNDTETIDDYVLNLNKENGSDSFSVYDDNHYSLTISESERQEVLKQYNSGEFIKESFKEIFSDEQYNSAFIKMDYDELFQNVTFYADKEKYNNAGLAIVFGPTIISYIYSDIVQAYSLIPVNERTCVIKIIDNETNDVIYDSSLEE